MRQDRLQFHRGVEIKPQRDAETVAERGGQTFPHWKLDGWRDTLADPANLAPDRDDGSSAVDEARLPRHLEPRWQRAVKYLLHGSGIWP